MHTTVPQARRLRVLLIAEAANPSWVSVPLVGWSHAYALSKVTDAHLVTQVRNVAAIRETELLADSQFSAINTESVLRPARKVAELLGAGGGKAWTILSAVTSLTYPRFEQLTWERFGAQIRRGDFDIVHRITPLSPTTPSPMASWCRRAGVPFIIGPLNGGVPWPAGFDAARRKEREWLSYVRDAYRLLPGYRSTRRDAAALLIASRDTWRQMPRQFHDKCIYLPENGIDPSRFSVRRTRRAGRPIKAVFLGRLVPYKGADMLLEAAEPLLKTGRLTLDIIGDGPQMPLLRQRVASGELGDAARLVGWVAHDQVQQRLADADVMTFPSVREFGGAVALEAMAVGTVPIVMDYGGTGELVTDRTGYRLPMGPREQIVRQLRELLAHLAENPGEIDRKSGAAYDRAHRLFTWDAKAQQVLAVYHWVLGNGPRPDFGMPFHEVEPTDV